MTEDEAIKRLKFLHDAYASDGDDEETHSQEDVLLVDIVRSLGWSRFIEMYENCEHSRWCA